MVPHDFKSDLPLGMHNPPSGGTVQRSAVNVRARRASDAGVTTEISSIRADSVRSQDTQLQATDQGVAPPHCTVVEFNLSCPYKAMLRIDGMNHWR